MLYDALSYNVIYCIQNISVIISAIYNFKYMNILSNITCSILFHITQC